MSFSVWFHVYAAGDWEGPTQEFLDALGDAELMVNVGIVGSREQRAEVVGYLFQRQITNVVAEADEGYEQITLLPLSKAVRKLGGHVLYAHTKGASDPSELNVLWRRTMLERVVRNRKHLCSETWKHGYDAVGTNYVTPEEYQGIVLSPFFGGNFWIATARYLRTLPSPRDVTRDRRGRFDAESWIGSGAQRPYVLNLLPGWPSVELFRKAQQIAVADDD